jgi:pre-60S factor REI1
LEWSDFYDYSSSYDQGATTGDADDWEDVDEGSASGDEVVSSEEDLEQGGLRLGDNIYELVLPTGKRIGHRAMKNLYKQNFVYASPFLLPS